MRVQLLALPRHHVPGARCTPERNVALRRVLSPEPVCTPDAAAQPPPKITEKVEPPAFVLLRRAQNGPLIALRLHCRGVTPTGAVALEARFFTRGSRSRVVARQAPGNEAQTRSVVSASTGWYRLKPSDGSLG